MPDVDPRPIMIEGLNIALRDYVAKQVVIALSPTTPNIEAGPFAANMRKAADQYRQALQIIEQHGRPNP